LGSVDVSSMAPSWPAPRPLLGGVHPLLTGQGVLQEDDVDVLPAI